MQIRQQLAEQSDGYLEDIQDERLSDRCSGVTLNVKRGDPGSLVHKNMCEVEPYTGMGTGGWQKRLVEVILDQPDVTGHKNSHGATPEAAVHAHVLTLESGDVKMKNTKHLVPASRTGQRLRRLG